ncbi:MAG: hypothetical protein WC658_00385, partial [Candidatus Omnitrophota bacterium]
GIPLDKELQAIISSADKETRDMFLHLKTQIKSLAKLKSLSIEAKYAHLESSITSLVGKLHITIPLGGILDIERIKLKLAARIEEAGKLIKNKERTLQNKEFVKKAPPEIVKTEKEKLAELKEALKRLEIIRGDLS